MKNYCINLVIISKEIIEYLRINKILDYNLRCDTQFICHGLNGKDRVMDYFIRSVLKIFKLKVIEDLYIRNGSVVISGLYYSHTTPQAV
jgi:argonaute-like protein implicated in RNA metabolism and viral defense